MKLNTSDIIKYYDFLENETLVKIESVKNQGLCNRTYILNTDKNRYIVKKINKSLYGNTNKKLEFKIQLLAYRKGIAPKPIFLDVKNQIFISRYLEGCHKEYLNKSKLKSLAVSLNTLHNIKLHSKTFDIKRYFEKNSKMINSNLKLALLKFDRLDKDLVLCHNDLNPGNILFSDGIKFIDWEFASINDRYFDLCSIIIEFRLSPRDEHLLLNLYLKGKKPDTKKLEIYKTLYKHLCKTWFDIIS